MKGEVRVDAELAQSRLFQGGVVVVVDAVDPDHGAAGGEQVARQAEADEACGPADQNGIGRGVGHRVVHIAALRRLGRC